MPSGKQKEITVLKKLIVAEGFKVVPSGSGHWKVVTGKGAVVTDKDGPIILSGTSSEVRGRDMAVHRLMAANVLKMDPWAPQKGKKGDTADPEEKVDPAAVALRERIAESDRSSNLERSERTRKIRERLEPIVAKLGGWEKRGVLSEIGLVAHYVASRVSPEDAWPDAKAAAENADALRKGATLSQLVAPLWEALLSELEEWPDIRVRWFQLVSEAKGTDEPTIGAMESRSGWNPKETLVVAATNGGKGGDSGDDGLPMLALRAMFEMGVGRPAQDPDRRHILELGVEIARLEMQAYEGETGSDDS